MNIKYVFSNLMTFEEFEKYINSLKDKDGRFLKKFFLLIFKDEKLEELIPFIINKDMQLNPFKRKGLEYYIALEENGKLIKDVNQIKNYFNKTENDIDKEYIEYLKSFKTPRIVSENEKDTLEYEEAIYSGDLIWKMEYKNGKFEAVGHLTNQGYQKMPMSQFHKIINWFLKLI